MTAPIPTAELERLIELGEKATKGPWHFVPENAGLMSDHGYGLLYGEADSWGWEKNLYISVGCSGNVSRALGEAAAENNARLIALYRNIAPALARELIQAREALAGLNRVIDEYWNDPHRDRQPRKSCHEKAITFHQGKARALLPQPTATQEAKDG